MYAGLPSTDRVKFIGYSRSWSKSSACLFAPEEGYAKRPWYFTTNAVMSGRMSAKLRSSVVSPPPIARTMWQPSSRSFLDSFRRLSAASLTMMVAVRKVHRAVCLRPAHENRVSSRTCLMRLFIACNARILREFLRTIGRWRLEAKTF